MTPFDPPQGLSRRDFLRATAAGASLVAAPALFAAEADPKEKPRDLALAVIGCGSQGLILIDQAVKMAGVRFKAVCDIWPYSQNYGAARLKAYGQEVTRYADYQEMLAAEKGLDAVLIASPDWCHAAQAIACVKAGLHVYCEEPMAPALKEARDMVLAARQAKRLLQIGYQRRSNPRYLAAAEYLTAKKACGSILAAAAQWNHQANLNRGWPKEETIPADVLKKHGYESMERLRDWLWYKPFSAGPMSRQGATQLDVLSWLLGGPPRAVLAAAARHGPAGLDWPDTWYAIYEWDLPAADGKRSTVLGRYQILQGSSHRGYFEEVTGDEGTLRLSEAQPHGRLIREYIAPLPDWEKALTRTPFASESEMSDNASLEPLEDEFYVAPPSWLKPEPRDYGLPVKDRPYFEPHLENFFEAIRKGSPLTCPGEIGYQALATALAANDAVASGKRLELKPDDFKV
jgi:predicted dehydrogenase